MRALVFSLGLVLTVLLSAPVLAEDPAPADAATVVEEESSPPVTVDAVFDKTGDGIVDASDWREMSEKEKLAYANESLKAMGEVPESVMPDGKSKGERYLQALKEVYE